MMIMKSIKDREMDRLVFSTSIRSEKDLEPAASVLNSMKGTLEWNVDLEDWEKVLRIEVSGVDVRQIVSALRSEGISIREMKT